MKKTRLRLFMAAGLSLMLLLACSPKDNQPSPQPAKVIPTPVELIVGTDSISANKLTNLPQKVSISEKDLLCKLGDQALTDWQLKSA